jgi:hypothetical protein
MSFDHKAFAFEWTSFHSEMAELLGRALRSGDPSSLEKFIDSNISACSSPYDGEKLDADWRKALEVGGLQEIADFALTKYYDPAADHGLHEEWADIESGLPRNPPPPRRTEPRKIRPLPGERRGGSEGVVRHVLSSAGSHATSSTAGSSLST